MRAVTQSLIRASIAISLLMGTALHPSAAAPWQPSPAAPSFLQNALAAQALLSWTQITSKPDATEIRREAGVKLNNSLQKRQKSTFSFLKPGKRTLRRLILAFQGMMAVLHADPMFKAGVGYYARQPIEFTRTAEKVGALDAEEMQNFDALSKYFTNTRSLLNKYGEHSTPDEELLKEHIGHRVELTRVLLSSPKFVATLKKQLERLDQMISDNDEIKRNQAIYAGLPAWLAEYGVLLVIDFPLAYTEADFLNYDESKTYLESWTTYAVDEPTKVVTVSLPGKTVSSPEVRATNFFNWGTNVMALSTPSNNGINFYRLVILYPLMVDNAIQGAMNRYKNVSDILVETYEKLEWANEKKNPKFNARPLNFAWAKMAVKAKKNPLTADEAKEWITTNLSAHEHTHNEEQANGDLGMAEWPKNWKAYRSTILKKYMTSEMTGLGAQASATPKYSWRELMQWIERVLEDTSKIESVKARAIRDTDKLMYFNLLVQFLDEAEISYSKKTYPELIIDLKSNMPLRHQIAGQVDLFTDANMAKIMNLANEYIQKNPDDVETDPAFATQEEALKSRAERISGRKQREREQRERVMLEKPASPVLQAS